MRNSRAAWPRTAASRRPQLINEESSRKQLVVKITHLSPAEVPMNGPKPA